MLCLPVATGSLVGICLTGLVLGQPHCGHGVFQNQLILTPMSHIRLQFRHCRNVLLPVATGSLAGVCFMVGWCLFSYTVSFMGITFILAHLAITLRGGGRLATIHAHPFSPAPQLPCPLPALSKWSVHTWNNPPYRPVQRDAPLLPGEQKTPCPTHLSAPITQLPACINHPCTPRASAIFLASFPP